MVRHLLLSHCQVHEKVERNHGQEQLKLECPVPVFCGSTIHRTYEYQTANCSNKVDGKAYSGGNCPVSSQASEGKEQDHRTILTQSPAT
jgi:hypothetical protein